MDTLTEMQETMGITPKGLADRPTLTNDDLPYLEGFRRLDRGRAYGQVGPMPITVVDVQAYLSLIKEEEVGERLRFLNTIQTMDSTYLGHASKKSEASV